MRPPTLALLLLLAVVAAGCGGSSGPKYTLQHTKTCLDKAGYRAFPVKNHLLSGSQGNLQVQFTYGAEDIYIVFGKNSAEAKSIEDRAVTQTEINNHIDRNTILNGVTQEANVFYYSDFGPLTAVGRQHIDACLS